MQIDFYEEFPTKENLDRLKLVEFPCRVFIAAKSIKEFENYSEKTKKINKKIRPVYWPILKNSYWISPFSNTKDLEKIFRDLNKNKCPLLIDLEPPLLNKRLFLKNLLKFRKNKALIKNFLKDNKKRITTAQAPPILNLGLRELSGIEYNLDIEKGLMWYSSVYPDFINKKIKKNLLKIQQKESYIIGLGVIAQGVFSEDLMSYIKLEEDLNFIKKAGFKKVAIFRLGGLNEEYMQVVNKFS